MARSFCPTCKEEYGPEIKFCPNDGTALISHKAENRLDQIFDQRYRLTEKIGEGGMGSVYKAVQMSTGKSVAVKVISAKHTQNEETIRRFQREVKLQTKLTHPNLVSLLDFSRTAEGEYYFVMEYVEGKSLTKFIKEKGQLSMQDFMEISSQLCDGLEYAHRQGIIHRDLKGDNIIVTDIGHQLVVKILDFGLAKAIAEDHNITAEITQMGSALGTPAYMAPEQAMGEVSRMGTHTDIYTLGVIFYQMITGQLPFRASTPWGLMQKHISEAPVPVRDHNRQAPATLDKIIMKCLEKDPDARYSSAVSVKRDLEKTTLAIQKETKINLSDSTETTLNLKAVKSRNILKSFLLGAAVFLGIFAIFYTGLDHKIAAYFSDEQPPPPTLPHKDDDKPVIKPSDGGQPVVEEKPLEAEGPSMTGEKVLNQKLDEETYRKVFLNLINNAGAAMDANELVVAAELLRQAEALFPSGPELDTAKKTLAGKLEQVAKAISDDIGYIEAIDKKWGFIIISKLKGVKVDLGEILYTTGKDGQPKELVVKKIRTTKLSVVTKEKLDQFKEGMKVIRNNPPKKAD